jgi:hypothetical protein
MGLVMSQFTKKKRISIPITITGSSYYSGYSGLAKGIAGDYLRKQFLVMAGLIGFVHSEIFQRFCNFCEEACTKAAVNDPVVIG